MKKLILSFILAGILVVFAWLRLHSHQSVQKEASKPMVKIAAIFPLSGQFAFIGEGLSEAFQLAQADLKQQDLKNDYHFITENDGFESKKTISAMKKLASIDKVDAVITFSSQSAAVVAPLAEQNKIIHLNVGASDENVAKGKYNFIHWTLPVKTSRRLLEFYQKHGLKKIAMVSPYNLGASAIEEAITQNLRDFPQMELKIFNIQPTERDFRLLFAKIKNYQPDVILTTVYGDTAYPFLKQYQQAGLPYLLSNQETFATLTDFSLAEGAYYSDVATTEASLIKRLHQKNPHAGEFGIGNIYDAVMLLAQAYEKASSPQKAVDELSAIKTYEGALGHLSQDDKGIFNSDAVLKKVVNAKPEVVKE